MKRLIHKITSLGIVVASFAAMLSAPVLLPATSLAASNIDQAQDGVDRIGGNNAGNRGVDFTNLLENIINLLLFIIGAVAVIMIIVGGIRYTTSNGDQAQVTGAKNTILYAVVGLVVAIMAFAIVNFVLNSLEP